ncbi:MAG: M17 family peptidase N-terminal domain-containing protein [Myxococcota bacterium]
MADPRLVDIVVRPLTRALLDGVDDEAGETAHTVDLVVLPCFEDERPLQGLAGLIDWRLGGRVSTLVRDGFCTGKAGETVLMPAGRILPMQRVVVLGLGPSDAFDRSAAEALGERMVAMIEGIGPTDVMVAMPGRVADRTVVEAVFNGLTRALDGPHAEAAVRPAALAVGDETGGSVAVDGEAESSSPSKPEPGRGPVLAPEQDSDEPSEGSGSPVEVLGGGAPEPRDASDEVSRGGPPETSEETDEPGRRRYWVVADPRHEARLRRLLEGPPRAAQTDL